MEKDIFQELIRFYSMTILATPKDHNPDRGAMNFTSLLEGFVDIITMHLVFPNMCGSRDDFFGGYIWQRLWHPMYGTRQGVHNIDSS